MTKIKDALIDSNPWWKQPFSIDFKERELYSHIQKYLPLRQIIAFTGLRRVGKTTLMYKIIQDQIQKGLGPQNMIYFSFDDFRTTDIQTILDEYQQLTKKNFRDNHLFLLLDEIQKLDNWEEQVKRLYDLHGTNVKIILSGSESLFVRKQSKATLAGRLFEFIVHPLSFREYLQFIEPPIDASPLYEKELQIAFNDYMITQGFPELVGINDKEIIKKYIKESILEKVIYRDIPSLYSIKDIPILQTLMNTFLEDPGQMIDLSELAGELNITRQTLSTYISYLQDSFLIRKLYNYSTNKRKTERKLKRYYPTILSVDLLFKQDDYSRSKIFEAFLINQLKAEYFWRDPYKHEVDMIQTNDSIFPIEMKYGKIETKNLIKFMDTFNVNNAFILTTNKEQVLNSDEKTIHIIPAYKFLLREVDNKN